MDLIAKLLEHPGTHLHDGGIVLYRQDRPAIGNDRAGSLYAS